MQHHHFQSIKNKNILNKKYTLNILNSNINKSITNKNNLIKVSYKQDFQKNE